MKKILLIIMILLLTGCYDYKELNQIAIIGATSIDKIDDNYIVKIQVINPQNVKESTSDNTSFVIYEEVSDNLQEAYRKITNYSPRFTYSDHMQVLFLSEDILKSDFSEVMDFLMRNPSVRNDFYVLIEKNGSDIIELTTPINQISSSSIKSSLENNSKHYGTSKIVNFNDFSSMYLNPNIEIVLPSINLVGDIDIGQDMKNTMQSNNYVKYELSNLGIFKDNKLIGYLTSDESLSYNFIMNKIDTAIVSYECDNEDNVVVDIEHSKTKIKVNKNKININISTNGNLIEVGCNLNMDEKEIKNIEKNISNKIKNMVSNSISSVIANYNSDIFGFLDLYYKNDYKYYKKIKNKYYDDIFRNLDININVKTRVSREGTILEVLNEKD